MSNARTIADLAAVTATAAELNLTDGSAADTVVNSKAVVYGSAGEVTVNELDVDNIQLDANAIKSTNTNGNIQLFPNGTGYTELYGNTNPGAVRFNCESNTHGVTLKGPPHSATATYSLELPDADGSSGEVLQTDGSGKLSFAAVSAGPTVVANANLSGGSVSFTGIPSGVSHVWINIHQASTASSSQPCSIRLGTSSGILTSGYHNSAGWVKGQNQVDTTDSTTNLVWMYDAAATEYFSGIVHLAKQSDNTWVMNAMGASNQSTKVFVGGGGIALSAELTQLQVNCNNGFQNFDSGTVSISYMQGLKMKTIVDLATNTVQVVPLSAEEQTLFDAAQAEYEAGADARLAFEVRKERDIRLRGSDWAILEDTPTDKVVWQTYRQALRDVPQQEGFPQEIIWPEKPEQRKK